VPKGRSKFSLGSRRRLHYVGPDYLVMEYIEGAPLKEPLPVDEAVRLAHFFSDVLKAGNTIRFSVGPAFQWATMLRSEVPLRVQVWVGGDMSPASSPQ
jgi:hypothetical protein